MAGDPLRVLHLNFHRGWGGQPQRILMASRRMARQGHALALAVPGDSVLAERARAEGLTVFGGFGFRPPARVASFVRDVIRLRRVIAAWRPGLLHSHGSQDTWVAAVANRWAGGPRLPHMLTRHNTKPVADNVANRYLYGRAIDRLVVASGSVLDRYGPFIERGLIRPEQVPVIHSAIEFDRFDGRADGGRVRRELGLAGDDRLVGCIGRLVPDKGQAYLLRAVALLRPRFPGLHAVLAGVGTEEPALRRLAGELGLSGRVHFLGFREDVPEITAALDVSVLPSIDCDASSAVLKEAMAMARPVVATDIGGAAEIVEDGETGVIVPPGDAGALAAALDRILSSPETAERMGARGRATVEQRFSQEILVRRYVAAYEELLEWKAGRGRAAASV